jgi:NTE family protein
MNRRTGLVLTGGGAKAAYQAGAIRALADLIPYQQSPFQVICGTSAGAINSALIATHAHDWQTGARKLESQWKNISLDQVFYTDAISVFSIALGWIFRTLFGGSIRPNGKSNFLLDTRPLKKLLDHSIDFDQIRKNISAGDLHAISFTVVEYFNSNSIIFFEGSEQIHPWKRSGRFGQRTRLNTDHILASAAIPIFFPPVKIEGRFFGDGSLRQTTPLSSAIHLGAEKILSIGIKHDPITGEVQTPAKPILNSPSLAQISGELLNSIFIDSIESDVENLHRINHTVDVFQKQLQGSHPTTFRKIDHLHLRPSRDLQTLIPNSMKQFPPLMRFLFHGIGASRQQGGNLTGYLSFTPECAIPMMELGYEDTVKRKQEIQDFLGK